MEIALPAITEQQKLIFEASITEAIAQLQANKSAPAVAGQTEIDESAYPRTHLLREREGWEPPHPDIVGAYFRHFQRLFADFDSDRKLALLLGVSSDRRIRDFKQGRPIPYGIWRKFLVITGRVAQEIIPVLVVVR